MNTRPQFWLILLATALIACPARSDPVVESFAFTLPGGGAVVPDNGIPLVLPLTVSSSIRSISSVEVSLKLHGTTAEPGWAGDMFASLNLNLGPLTAVLLHQPGVDPTHPAGYGFDGWDITLSDSAAGGDVHWGEPGTAARLTGLWQPDGRVDPLSADRPSPLGVFGGSSAVGSTWYLTLADVSPGGRMLMESISLKLVGVPTPVPEPVASGTAVAGALLVFRWWWRRSDRSRRSSGFRG